MTKTVVYIKDALKSIYPPEEVNAMLSMIMGHVFGLQPHQFLMGDPLDVNVDNKNKIDNILERLKEHEPIQYILGEVVFCDITLSVNPYVLIPRPETAELVNLICKDYAGKAPRVLDLCTGSGCIAIAIAKKLPGATLTAVDISGKALETARRNANINNVEIEFIEADVLNATTSQSLCGSYDIIVSNPPYITEKEKAEMDPNVLDYEPSMALFVPNDGAMLFYRPIGRLALMKLNAGGILYFEINSHYGKETLKTIKEEGFGKVELIKDIYDNDRIIKAQE